MCGLVGICGTMGVTAETDNLDAALQAIAHRGPDGFGRFDSPWVSLRHARLSIIDLSASANQPMHSADGRFVIVYNGEIYNYQELYRRYLHDDPAVNKNSDTSVLLSLFIRFGKHCLPLLNGMFAFAICDLETRRIFLARDRFGEKPLFWTLQRNIFAFASELRALRTALPALVGDIDNEACAIYHMIGSIPAPNTIYRNVSALAPGHWLDLRGDKIQIGRYWSLPAPAEDPAQGARLAADALSRTREHLLDAVQSRMVSDVPVGLFLSGGFDSGSILSLLASSGFAGTTAICLDFPEAKYSEYELAKRSSESYGGVLHRHVIDAGQFVGSLPAFFAAMDQPTNDGFNTYFVCQAARELGIKVWLSGVGGDEAFGGYPSFSRLGRLSALARILRFAPSTLVEYGAAAVRDYPRLSRVAHLGDRGSPNIRAYQTLRNALPWRLARDVVSPIWNESWRFPELLDRLYPDHNPRADAFQIASLFESHIYMGSQLLRDIDNFSMAHSIELRAPFLSHRLFESVYLLEQALKRSSGESKPLLANALPNPLPKEVRAQPKRGFTFPLEVWLRSFIRKSFEDVAFDPSMRTIWDQRVVRRFWEAHLAGRVHWGTMWQLYAFARWRLETCAR